jgi:hypothetical protein
MIHSTSSSDRPLPSKMPLTVPARRLASEPGKDSFAPQQLLALRAVIDSEPSVREDMIVRGLALAADENYPSAEAMRAIARQIIGAADLTQE